MKKVVGMFLCALFFIAGSGCAKSEKDQVALRIGGINVTVSDFETAYQELKFAPQEMPPRKAFLDRFITRKLILQEAEKMGLDKKEEFLQDVQIFWEQTLLKMTLSQKMNEIASLVYVTDEEVKTIYDTHKEKMYPDKEYSQVYSQIKWSLLKAKQNKALTDWISSLKDNKKIAVKTELLGIEE